MDGKKMFQFFCTAALSLLVCFTILDSFDHMFLINDCRAYCPFNGSGNSQCFWFGLWPRAAVVLFGLICV